MNNEKEVDYIGMSEGAREKVFMGVRRSARFSPNMVANDDAIFSGVAAFLRGKGCTVNLYSEEEFIEMCAANAGIVTDDTTKDCIAADGIFTMMRSDAAVKRLQELERRGVAAVNSAFGIENCHRGKMTDIFLRAGISTAESMIARSDVRFDTGTLPHSFDRCWVKRADAQPTGKSDVSFVESINTLNDTLEQFAARGVEEVVVNAHLPGDLIKFYGVSGTGFFYHFYPSVSTHSKFGLEAINGAQRGFAFSEEGLRQLCNSAAKALGVQVYGGDCIVAADGTIRIIDFNDWPSFSPCRDEAAAAIGNVILKNYKHND